MVDGNEEQKTERVETEMAEQIQIPCGENPIIIETGKMAKQAAGSVTVQQGGTTVLVAVVCADERREGIDFLPLTVDYREKTYAAGKIPGGFFKREGRPTEREILTCRLIDRPIRPLFPEGFTNELQVYAIVLSSDREYNPDVLAVLGASAALSISDIPFQEAIGACRVGRVNGQIVINPQFSELEESTLNLVVASSKEGILMVEAGANQEPEDVMLEALDAGFEHNQQQISAIEQLKASVGVPDREYTVGVLDPAIMDQVRQQSAERIRALYNGERSKAERKQGLKEIRTELIEALVTEEGQWSEKDIKMAIHDVDREVVRGMILNESLRDDGRGLTEIRPITIDVGILPRTHGSCLFTRGETQALCVATLGTGRDEQLVESLEGESRKSFMLHYNFPSFSVGEVRRPSGPGRREIGHGALAERAITPIVPAKEDFPYTLRVVSEILESNGSSSMATICATSMSLMDGGVPIEAAVAGIAMGLIMEGDQVSVLTDISGSEDHLGDMDFKVAGTREGITALQMDIKAPRVTPATMRDAIEAARTARFEVLDKMEQALARPREALSDFAPRISVLQINVDRIRDVIGPGGKMIRSIIAETGASIDVEDDGTIYVSSVDAESSQKAIKWIEDLTAEVEVGKIYTGTIRRIMNFGAFAEILPGRDGLIHVSKLSEGFVDNVEDIVKVGDEVRVKVVEIDDQKRINLSKVAADREEGRTESSDTSDTSDTSDASDASEAEVAESR